MSENGVERNFRLKPDTLLSLTEEADKQGITLNALVSRILGRYVEFGRYAERNGFISPPGWFHGKIQSALSEGQTTKLADEIASNARIDYLHGTGKKPAVQYIIEYFCLHMWKNCSLGSYEIAHEDGIWYVTLTSPRASGAARWAKYYIPAVFRTLAGITPEITVTETTIYFSISDSEVEKPTEPLAYGLQLR